MATADYINIAVDQPGATKAQDLVTFKNAVRQVLLLGPPLLGIMNHNFSDQSGLNFTPLETLFGIPTGEGQTVFDMINGVMGAMQGTMMNAQAVELINRVG